MIINNLSDAKKYFIMEKGKQGDSLTPYYIAINGDRGPIMWIIDFRKEDEIITRRYYLSFKRDWLHSFKYLFHKPSEGWGQTFNMRALRRAATDTLNPSMVVCMPNESIYYCKANIALAYIESEDTIRTPSTESEEEGSIPARMLMRHDDY